MEEDLLRRYGISADVYEMLRKEMKQLLLNDDDEYVDNRAIELAAGYPLAFLDLGLLEPVLMEISGEWYHGNRPYEDVDAAWMRAARIMPLMLRQRIAENMPARPPVLVCNVEGNEHGLGARILADLLTEAGYRARLLEPPTRRTEIIRESRSWEAACVCLSISMPDQREELQATAAALRRDGYTGKITAGGQGIPPDFRQEAGIDWAGTNPLDFIDWLDRELAAPGAEEKAA